MNVLLWDETIGQLDSADRLPTRNVQLRKIDGWTIPRWQLRSANERLDLNDWAFLLVVYVPDAVLLVEDTPVTLVQGNGYRLLLQETVHLSVMEPDELWAFSEVGGRAVTQEAVRSAVSNFFATGEKK